MTLLAWPDSESLRPGSGSRKHVELTMTRVTTHTGQPGSLAPARVTRSSPQSITLLSPPRSPHSQRPAVIRSGLPTPAAGRHSSHSQWPAVTRHSPPQSTRPRHSPRPVSLGWRRGPPLLAAARLAASVTCRRRGAILCLFVYEFIYEFILRVFIYI